MNYNIDFRTLHLQIFFAVIRILYICNIRFLTEASKTYKHKTYDINKK